MAAQVIVKKSLLQEQMIYATDGQYTTLYFNLTEGTAIVLEMLFTVDCDGVGSSKTCCLPVKPQTPHRTAPTAPHHPFPSHPRTHRPSARFPSTPRQGAIAGALATPNCRSTAVWPVRCKQTYRETDRERPPILYPQQGLTKHAVQLCISL